jgi:transposase-like protein
MSELAGMETFGKFAEGRMMVLRPEALKREIVAASYAPGSSVSIVARRYDVNASAN